MSYIYIDKGYDSRTHNLYNDDVKIQIIEADKLTPMGRITYIVEKLDLQPKSSIQAVMKYATDKYGMVFKDTWTLNEQCIALEKNFCDEKQPHDPRRLGRVIEAIFGEYDGREYNLPEVIQSYLEFSGYDWRDKNLSLQEQLLEMEFHLDCYTR